MRTLFFGILIGAALMALVWLWVGGGPGGGASRSGPPAGPPELIVSRSTGAASAGTAAGGGTGAGAQGDPAPVSGPASSTVAPPVTSGSMAPGSGLSPGSIIDSARQNPAIARAAPSTVPQKAGLLSSESVRAGVAAATPAVKKCYEEALAQKPGLSGKLLVEFVIAQEGGRGRIREADIDEGGTDEAMLNPFLGMCVLKALGDVEFDPPASTGGDGEIVVRFPFQFESQPDDNPESP